MLAKLGSVQSICPQSPIERKPSSNNLKASTYRSYNSILNKHLLPIFGKLQLDSIQKEDIKTFLSNKRQEKVKRTGKKLSINRVKRIKAVLLGIFSSAVDDHEIASNPADRLGHVDDRCYRATA